MLWQLGLYISTLMLMLESRMLESQTDKQPKPFKPFGIKSS